MIKKTEEGFGYRESKLGLVREQQTCGEHQPAIIVLFITAKNWMPRLYHQERTGCIKAESSLQCTEVRMMYAALGLIKDDCFIVNDIHF